VDAKTRRTLENFSGEILRVENPKGTLTNKLWDAVKTSLNLSSPVKIIVEGEEDLAVTPFIIEGDSDTIIFYGLKDKGFVVVEVNKKVKEDVKKLLEKMGR